MDYGLRTGQAVFTIDGDKLGEVKELRGDYFKVDASMQPDYWLSCSCVRGGSMGSDRVTVSFDKDHLKDFKRDNPVRRWPAAASHRPRWANHSAPGRYHPARFRVQ
jgi:hypothetical protein